MLMYLQYFKDGGWHNVYAEPRRYGDINHYDAPKGFTLRITHA